jgi:hypothetical protein
MKNVMESLGQCVSFGHPHGPAAAYSRGRAGEPSRSYLRPRVPEVHTVRMWLNILRPDREFVCEGGDVIRVLAAGEMNRHEGPDFLAAEIIVNGRLCRGDIEIHTEADDWWRHGHSNDPAYARVILHVALYAPTRRDPLPRTLLLPGQLDASLRDAWSSVLSSRHPMPCSSAHGIAPHPDVDAMLLLMSLRRFDRKVGRMRQRFGDECSFHTPEAALRQVAWEAVARSAGYGGNQDRFERMARVLKLEALLRLPSTSRAAHLTAAGANTGSRPGTESLLSWRECGVMPLNRPAPRIGWLAALAPRLDDTQWWSALASAALTCHADDSGFQPLFRIEGERGSPGADRLAEIITNVVAPLLVLLAEEGDDAALHHAARALFFGGRHGAGNRITRIVAPVLGQSPPYTTACQQGMIELFTDFCSQSACSSCLLSPSD